MADFSKRAPNASLYFFEAAQLDTGTFQVIRFEGTEQISRPFEFELQLISKDPDLDFDKVVDKPATFTMMRGDEEVPIHGIVTNFSLHGQTADQVVYEAMLRPRLWRLGLSKRSRIFQEMKVEDILRTVFKEDGLSPSAFKFKLNESYSPREYCVQYQETDLNFVSRLMEFEGMCYFFDHEGGEETLIVTDKKSEHEKIASTSSISYYTGAEGMDRDEEIVRQLKRQEQVVTGKVKLKDYDYRTADTLSAESQVNDDMPGTRYEYGEHYRDTERGKRLAKVRNEEIEAQHRTVQTESDCMGLRSGHLFTLENHFRKSLNQDYLVTKVEHEGSQRAGLDIGSTRESEEPTYRNSAKCIPASVQYRPPRDTPKPEVSGVLTAKIESAGGDYAYIDDQGQYRAEMHFDEREGRSEGTKTLPVRMAQPYSGSDYGMHFPNHAGTEVILAFENGDIDRPVALGTAPNPSNKSPTVSSNKTQNIIRSFAGNEMILEDEEGATKIKLESTDKHKIEMDDGAPKITIRTSNEHNFELDDDNERITLCTEGGHCLRMEEGDINGIWLYSSGGNSLTLDDDDEMMILQTIGANTLKMHNKKGGSVVELNTSDGNKVKVEDSDDSVVISTSNGNNKIKVTESGEKINVEAKKEIEMKAGKSSIKLKKNGNIKISGKNVTVEGSKKVKVDGSGSTAEYTSSSASIDATAINLNS